MNPILSFVKWLSSFFKHLGRCGNTGFIAGCFTGIILTLLDIQYGGTLSLTAAEFYRVGAILIVFCWIVIVFLFVALAKFKFSQVAIPAFINVIIVAFLTVFLSWKWDVFKWAWLIGMCTGILIGYLLCRGSKLFK